MTLDPSARAVAIPAVAAPAERARPDMRLLGLLALGHMVVDINQGSLAALLPFLKSTLALSYTATGVSIFSTGGNVGVALGPPLITALVTGFGLRGSLGMLIPGVLVAALLTAVLPGLSAPAPSRARASSADAGRTMVKAMTLLILVVAARSWTQLGFTTYVPFYYLEVLHGDPRMVGTLLAIFLGAGAVGTLIAGPIADRVGARRYVVSVFLFTTPIAVGFLFARSALALVILGALGFVLVSTFTV